MDAIQITPGLSGELRVSSRVIAEACEIEHESVTRLIKEHSNTLEGVFGVLRFEIGKSTPKGGRPERHALLTEDHATFLITLFRNTEPVVRFKASLVAAFREAKNQLERTSEPALPGTYIEALEALVASEKSKALLALQNAEMAPKAAYFDTVAASDDLISLAVAAKTLNLGYGRNTLFKRLRDDKVLRYNNEPYQQYVDSGYFAVKERTNIDNKGKSHINHTTMVTGKGMDFLRRKYRPQSGELSL